jgi:Bacterial Ig-like domain (group 2)
MYPERSVFMRAHIWASLLIAAAVLPGCADTSFLGEVGSGSITNPGTSLTLELSRDSVSIEAGKSVPLLVTLSNGADPKSLGTMSWRTSDARVATVTNLGEVTGVSAGAATVSVTAGSVSANAKVTVTSPGAPGVPDTTITSPTGVRLPELPRDTVDVSMPAVTGRSIVVNAGGDLQAALDAAQPGDEVVVQAGATFTGTFVLRTKSSGTGWITVRSSGALPPAGTRITPADAPRLARLVAANAASQVLKTEAGAHHYRLIGLEITAQPGATLGYTLVSLGDASRTQNTMALQPHHLVLDRVYIHGTPTLSFQRCVALNSAWTAIVDSWLSECHGKGVDSQAIGGWNGTGPYKIDNNRLEGAAENIMFGGADPAIPNALPSDIVIRRNHIIKPPEWKGVWSVKTLLEIKIGQRVLIEGNILENSWPDAQTGFAINLKSTDQSNTAPWSETSDITVRYNLIRNTTHGVSIAAKPEVYPAVPASRMLFEQNVFDRIGMGADPGGRLFQVAGVDDLTLSHNTAVSKHSFLILVNSPDPIERLTVVDNIFAGSSYGLSGDGAGGGTAALDTRAPGWTFHGNVITGARGNRYPAGNSFPATVDLAGVRAALNAAVASSKSFVVQRLRAGEPSAKPGADISLISAVIAGVR